MNTAQQRERVRRITRMQKKRHAAKRERMALSLIPSFTSADEALSRTAGQSVAVDPKAALAWLEHANALEPRVSQFARFLAWLNWLVIRVVGTNRQKALPKAIAH